ncbi:uncharacterized protein BBA_06759 [Beauveria bassiana ARSEF 2860]|uniref:Uncharacterized protein n=1 Tax=Beauveria bassiana (strain ARSEF 2860) TaxID=655819 RepID=J4UK16_BEAB2|nr:uncharacterized protein BBA_06759 [Beauveria bassiana ARSEF 2860]EJP64377.1 hypothetical protein BBA_06759 [Beauveria bassiana ARSEF 2860]
MSAQLPTSPWRHRPIESQATPIFSFFALSDFAETIQQTSVLTLFLVPDPRASASFTIYRGAATARPEIIAASSAAMTLAITVVMAAFSSHEFSA